MNEFVVVDGGRRNPPAEVKSQEHRAAVHRADHSPCPVISPDISHISPSITAHSLCVPLSLLTSLMQGSPLPHQEDVSLHTRPR